MTVIKVQRIRTGTIYKLVLIGLVIGFSSVFTISGVLGAVGLSTVTWGEQPVTGIKAVALGPVMGILTALFFTAIIGSVMALGLWIYSKFRPVLIEFNEEASSE